jgi:hypothetical protein
MKFFSCAQSASLTRKFNFTDGKRRKTLHWYSYSFIHDSFLLKLLCAPDSKLNSITMHRVNFTICTAFIQVNDEKVFKKQFFKLKFSFNKQCKKQDKILIQRDLKFKRNFYIYLNIFFLHVSIKTILWHQFCDTNFVLWIIQWY